MPDPERLEESYLDLPAPSRASASESLGNELEEAQKRLMRLQREQEQLEKERRELEELHRKQDELEQGRDEMLDRMNRSVAMLERHTYEAQKRVEQLRNAHQSFIDHLRALESIDPKSWSKADLPKELSKGLSVVDQARAEYNQSRSRLNAEFSEELLGEDEHGEMVESDASHSFAYWLKSGFAFTLPLLILGLLAMLLALLR